MSIFHFDIDATLSVQADSLDQAETIFNDYITFISSGIPHSDFDLYDYDVRVEHEDVEDVSPTDNGSYTSFSSVVLNNAVQDVTQQIQQVESYTPMTATSQQTLPAIPGYSRLRTTRS
jgi:hypothetical protein